MSFNHVLPFPIQAGQLRVPLEKLERGIHDRASLILLPITRPNDRRRVFTALRIAWRTFFGTFDSLLLETAIVNDRYRIMLTAFVGAVHAPGKRVVQFLLPGCVRYFRLARKIYFETVLRVDVLV